MEVSLLFESFVVFYLLELVVLFGVAVWYYQEPKKVLIKNKNRLTSQGPTASQIIKMRRLADQIKRGQGIR